MPGLPGMLLWCHGLNAEVLQYAEDPHVLHVFFFRILKTFHDPFGLGPDGSPA